MSCSSRTLSAAVGSGVKGRVLAEGLRLRESIGPAWIPFEAQICKDVVAHDEPSDREWRQKRFTWRKCATLRSVGLCADRYSQEGRRCRLPGTIAALNGASEARVVCQPTPS
jgi:hypothetical protein